MLVMCIWTELIRQAASVIVKRGTATRPDQDSSTAAARPGAGRGKRCAGGSAAAGAGEDGC